MGSISFNVPFMEWLVGPGTWEKTEMDNIIPTLLNNRKYKKCCNDAVAILNFVYVVGLQEVHTDYIMKPTTHEHLEKDKVQKKKRGNANLAAWYEENDSKRSRV